MNPNREEIFPRTRSEGAGNQSLDRPGGPLVLPHDEIPQPFEVNVIGTIAITEDRAQSCLRPALWRQKATTTTDVGLPLTAPVRRSIWPTEMNI